MTDLLINRDVLTNSFLSSEIKHSRSDSLLTSSVSSVLPCTSSAVSQDDLALKNTSPYDALPSSLTVDPVDSIRDIVSENDLYRFVLFKRHYDKYVALSVKYEEVKGIVYYLEERYVELKTETDKLEETKWKLEQKLEGCISELRDKEEELFLQLERNLHLEDEIERVKKDRDTCQSQRDRLERDQAGVLKQLQLHTVQNEITRRSLERARQEVIKQATFIRAERDALEQENEKLKEKLKLEQNELGAERLRREEGIAALTQEAVTLRHAARHLRAAALHATACRRRRRCSVCTYAKRTFADVDDFQNTRKLFKCFQAPFQDLRSWLLPSVASILPPLRTSSPLDCEIGYIDESSSSSEDEYCNAPIAEISLSSTNSNVPSTSRAFSSDSGFSSEIGDRRSRSYECSSSHKSESYNCEDNQRQPSLNRTKWTSSFRKLLTQEENVSTLGESSPYTERKFW